MNILTIWHIFKVCINKRFNLCVGLCVQIAKNSALISWKPFLFDKNSRSFLLCKLLIILGESECQYRHCSFFNAFNYDYLCIYLIVCQDMFRIYICICQRHDVNNTNKSNCLSLKLSTMIMILIQYFDAI